MFAGGGVVGGAQEDVFVAAEVQVSDMCGEVSTYSYTTDLVDVLSPIRGRGGRGGKRRTAIGKKGRHSAWLTLRRSMVPADQRCIRTAIIRMHARDGIQMPQCMSAGWRIVEASQ